MTDPCVCVDCAVRRTMARYQIAGDRGLAEELAATFKENGVLDAQHWRAEGRAEIVARLKSLMAQSNPALTTARHNLTTNLIDHNGDGSVSARSYFMVTTDIGLDHTGIYTDRLLLVDGVWLFEVRKVRLNWVSPDTLFSLSVQRGEG